MAVDSLSTTSTLQPLSPHPRPHPPAALPSASTVPSEQEVTSAATPPPPGQATADDDNDDNSVQTSSSPQRPSSVRSATEPYPPKFLQVHRSEALQPRPPRNRSPLSRSHLRSFSASSSASTPAMQRTRSLPIVSDAARIGLRHSSPSHSPVRTPSPLRPSSSSSSSSSAAASSTVPRTSVGGRRSFDESMPLQSSLSASFTEIEIIEEDSELEVVPRPQLSISESETLSNFAGSTLQYGHAFSRSNSNRRRPASPLYHAVAVAPSPPNTQSPSSTPPSTFATLHSYNTPPPTIATTAGPQGTAGATNRFNEPFPQSATSSVPSTPTSLRSRSPSISSLETIPDSPDAEEAAAALAAYEVDKLKIAADEADVDGRGRVWGLGLAAAALSKQDKRKRWSVCGAERRGDFEMETIWED